MSETFAAARAATAAADFDFARWPAPELPWPLPYPAVRAMADDEQGPGGGVALKAYKCPAGVWTCGWGETDGVGPTSRWAKAYADQRLCDSLTERTHAVRALCTVEPTGNQLAALVRLAYNIGLGALAKSSVMKAHNRADHAAAARAFGLWNKARSRKTGQLEVMPGLVRRRAAEAAQYLQPDVADVPDKMPQAVAAEPALAASPTMSGGATLIGAGSVAAAFADAGGQASQAKGVLDSVKALVTDTLGVPAEWWLPAIMVAVGGLVMYRRWRQRRLGVA